MYNSVCYNTIPYQDLPFIAVLTLLAYADQRGDTIFLG